MIVESRRPRTYLVEYNKKKNETIYGLNRMGKSSLLEIIVQKHFDAGVKIWDIWDAFNREEPAFWNIPKDKTTNGIPCKVLIPLTETLPDKLPSVYYPFTIPISSVSLDTWQIFTGAIGKAHLSLGASLNVKSIHKCILRLNEIAKKKEFRTDKIGLRVRGFGKVGLASFTQPLNSILDGEVGILSNDNFRMNLDLKYERKHTEWITGISYRSVRNPIVRLFIFLYVFKKIFKLQQKNPRKFNLIAIREFADVCPARVKPNSPKDVVRNEIASMVKQSMGANLKLLIDVQSPSNVFEDTRSQLEHLVYSFRLSSSDIHTLMSGPGGSRLEHYDEPIIKGLKTGEFIQIDVEEPPPIWKFKVPYDRRTGVNPILRHHHKEPNDEFFRLWKGEWKSWKDTKVEIRELIISEIKKVEETEVKRIEKSKKPTRSDIKKERMERLKKYMKDNPKATQKEMAKEIGVSVIQTQNYIYEMKEKES